VKLRWRHGEAQWRHSGGTVRLGGDIVEARTRRVYFLTIRVKQREREDERVMGQVIKNSEKGEKK